MNDSARRTLAWFAILAGVAIFAVTPCIAQQLTPPPLVTPELADPEVTDAREAERRESDRDNDEDDDEEDDEEDDEPESVQRQMESVKRELRGQKFDLKKAAPIRDRTHQWALRVPSYVQIRQRNIVMQQRDYSCGAACLATICRYYWEDDVTENMVLEVLDELLTPEEIGERIENGLAMTDLRRAAVKLGYQSVVGKLTFEKLSESKVPVIVGIQPRGHKHFVVYRGTDIDWVYLADPIRGNIRMETWDFRKQWQENAVLVVHNPKKKVRDISPLSLTPFDVDRTQLNDYLIQTQQSRQPQSTIKARP
jgi:predicted double-glycine peptidase